MKNQSKWLIGEIPNWVERGLIPQDSADKLLAHYSEQAEGGTNWALIIFSIMGSLFIGTGVILLLAHNWTHLPRSARTIVSILPLLVTQALGGWFLCTGRKSIAMQEGLGIAISLALLASLALISQTYHTMTELDTFLLQWLILSLPVIYLFNSSAAAFIYLAGAITWSFAAGGFDDGAPDSLPIWLLLSLYAPHFALSLKTNRLGPRSAMLLWISALAVFAAMLVSVSWETPALWIPIFGFLFSSMYLIASIWFNDAGRGHRSLTRFGVIGSVLLTYILTFDGVWDEIARQIRRNEATSPVDYCIVTAVILMSLALFSTALRRKCKIQFSSCLPGVACLASTILLVTTKNEHLPTIVMNIYFFYLGLEYLVNGARHTSLGSLNTGMIIIAMFTIARFYDIDVNMLVRGILFILLGIAFLTTNILILRKRKKTS